MFILENLRIVLEKILNMLQKDSNLLFECLKKQKQRNENRTGDGSLS